MFGVEVMQYLRDSNKDPEAGIEVEGRICSIDPLLTSNPYTIGTITEDSSPPPPFKEPQYENFLVKVRPSIELWQILIDLEHAITYNDATLYDVKQQPKKSKIK